MKNTSIIDYDLHGLAGIRLVNASPADVAAVDRQLGPVRGQLAREPDIIIQFVDGVPTRGPIRHLGGPEVGYTDDAFLVRCGRRWALIDFESVGKRCVIICETGLPAVPLLVPIFNLTMLGKGVLPVHASAFTYQGTGMLAAGWAHGSKTGTLLAFMAHGATYIGDDWVYITGDGRRIYGLPQAIQVKDSYLQGLPQFRAAAGHEGRVKRRAIKIAQALARALLGRSTHQSLPARGLRRLEQALEGQLRIDVSPQQLFGAAACAMTGGLDKIILLVSRDAPEITTQRMEPSEMAGRLGHALQHERVELLSYYLKFQFAFPHKRNELIERAHEIQRGLLERMLADKETYVVYHPYPVGISDLFQAISLRLTVPETRVPPFTARLSPSFEEFART